MKKFKCLGCNSKSCYVEQEDDILTPCCCVHGWNGDTDWHEVKEVKGIVTDIPKWIIDGIFYEYHWACEKHHKFPNDPFQMMCIIQEELGEAIQALNDLKHHQQGVINDVNIELLHAIVTCLRTLMAINEKEWD
jgi:hypothetical protein